MRETGTYLDRILAQTLVTVDETKLRFTPAQMRQRAEKAHPPVDVLPRLSGDSVGVIAEFKRASPSKGIFPGAIDPLEVAQSYIAGGAAAISCLTDEPFFKGTLDDLDAVCSVATPVGVPVLRKDFILDPLQIDEARAHGASIILLIVAALDDAQLRAFREHAELLGMQALVEVHDRAEAERAVTSGARIVGINNRDLRTFDVDLARTEEIAPSLPSDVIVVSESGVSSREHVERMASAGADAVLVGESLIRQSDRSDAVLALSGVPRV